MRKFHRHSEPLNRVTWDISVDLMIPGITHDRDEVGILGWEVRGEELNQTGCVGKLPKSNKKLTINQHDMLMCFPSMVVILPG